MPVTAKVYRGKLLNGIQSVLKISKTVGYYSGQYYCVAENKVGKAISQTANLHVQGYNACCTLCLCSHCNMHKITVLYKISQLSYI